MVTNDERRRVASECRERAYREEFTGEAVARTIGAFTSGTTRYDHDAWYRLAAVIDPDCGTQEVGTSQVPQCDCDTRARLARAIGIDLLALEAIAGSMCVRDRWLSESDADHARAIAKRILMACMKDVSHREEMGSDGI